MNGALVIPKLMCIKFYRAEVERMIFLAQNCEAQRLKINKKKPGCVSGAGALLMGSAEGFKGLYPLQVRRNIFKLVALFFIPDDLVIVMQHAG